MAAFVLTFRMSNSCVSLLKGISILSPLDLINIMCYCFLKPDIGGGLVIPHVQVIKVWVSDVGYKFFTPQ